MRMTIGDNRGGLTSCLIDDDDGGGGEADEFNYTAVEDYDDDDDDDYEDDGGGDVYNDDDDKKANGSLGPGEEWMTRIRMIMNMMAVGTMTMTKMTNRLMDGSWW